MGVSSNITDVPSPDPAEPSKNVSEPEKHDLTFSEASPPNASTPRPLAPTEKIEIKKLGRPPKPKTCVRCALPKNSSDYRYGSDVCKLCGTELHNEAKAAKRAEKRRRDEPPKLTADVSPLLKTAQECMALREFGRSVLVALALPPVCSCCRESRDVTPDPVGGAQLCPVCMFQVVRCGRCDTHRSRVFYPALAAQDVVPVPIDLLRAYDLAPRDEPVAVASEYV